MLSAQITGTRQPVPCVECNSVTRGMSACICTDLCVYMLDVCGKVSKASVGVDASSLGF